MKRLVLGILVVSLVLPMSRGAAQLSPTSKRIPAGVYTYEEAVELGIDVGPTPEGYGLPRCESDDGYPGLGEDEVVPVDEAPSCVVGPRTKLFGVGLPIPHANAHHSSGYRSNALTDVDPLPATVRSDGVAIETEIAKRVSEWNAAIDAAALTESELADAILVLWDAMVSIGGDDAELDPRWSDIPIDDWWLAYRELGARLHALCVRLPVQHELRSDFCG